MNFQPYDQWVFYDLAGSLLSSLSTQIYPRYGSLQPHKLNPPPSHVFSKIFQDHLTVSIDKAHELVLIFSDIFGNVPGCYLTKTTTTCDFRYVPKGLESHFYLIDKLNEQMFYDLSQVLDPQSMALEWKRQIDHQNNVAVYLTFRPLFSTSCNDLFPSKLSSPI